MATPLPSGILPPTPEVCRKTISNWGGAAPLRHSISLFFCLVLTWLLLSGHFQTLPLILGATSCALVVYLAHRMDIIDHESQPLHLVLRLPRFWVWLSREIFKANFAVARLILDPRMPIDPRLFEVDPQQDSDLARVIYANSITLTPGTITTDLNSTRIQIHALGESAENDIRTGKMAAKVAALEVPR